MSKFSKGLIAGAAVLLVGASASAVSAGQDSIKKLGLSGWVSGANSAVDDVMTYPRSAERRGFKGGSIFQVTIDRDGDVLDSEIIATQGRAMLRSAARKVIRRADFPALPAEYKGDELTFTLKLDYKMPSSSIEAYHLQKESEVSVDRVRRNLLSAGRITIVTDDVAD